MSGQVSQQELARQVAETIKGEIVLPKDPQHRKEYFEPINNPEKHRQTLDWMRKEGKPIARELLVKSRHEAKTGSSFFFDYFSQKVLKSEDADIDHGVSYAHFCNCILLRLQKLAEDNDFRMHFMSDEYMKKLFTEFDGQIYINRYGLISFFNNLQNLHLLNGGVNSSKSSKDFLSWLKTRYNSIYNILQKHLRESEQKLIVGVVGLFVAPLNESYDFSEDLQASLHIGRNTIPFLDVLYDSLTNHTQGLAAKIAVFNEQSLLPFTRAIEASLSDPEKPLSKSKARTFETMMALSQGASQHLFSSDDAEGSESTDERRHRYFSEASCTQQRKSRIIHEICEYVINNKYSNRKDTECHSVVSSLLQTLTIAELQEVYEQVKLFQKNAEPSFSKWLKKLVDNTVSKRPKRDSVSSSGSSQGDADDLEPGEVHPTTEETEPGSSFKPSPY